MVFGWGKKKKEEIPEEIPKSKKITLSEVQKITQDLLNLRKTQTLGEIKSLKNRISPLIKELAGIAKALEKDDLKVDDIDKHLRIIVVRGKKQVIDVIKKEATELSDVSSFDDAVELNNTLNQKLKKIGDVLGRQTRVIHIFAKKYAAKLKEILAEMNSTNNEIQKLVKNFQDTKSSSIEIGELLGEIKKLENDSIDKNQRISESQNKLNLVTKEIKNIENSISQVKSSKEYTEFIKLNQSFSSFQEKKHQIKNKIGSQFTKISRPLSRYEYASSLDKDQKILLHQLIDDPFEVVISKNKDSIIIILENIRKGISSGSISVKDVEKTMGHLTETEELLDGFVNKVEKYLEKKKEIQTQLSNFDNSAISSLENKLAKNLEHKKDTELKISNFKKDIEENQENIPKKISEIEKKLRGFSHTDYNIIKASQN